MKFNLSFVKKATGGEVFGEEELSLTSVSIDSRLAKENSLFIALKGEKTDGHNFVSEALKKADAVMVSRKMEIDKSFILVDDTLKSFHLLAKEIRRKINPYVCVITGSVGKSSLKNLLGQTLSEILKDLEVSQGNLNSITGLPLTISNISDKCKYLILEAGINKIGEMEVLSFVSEPNFVLFTGVKPVHLEFLGTLQEVGREKTRVLKYLKEDGLIIYPEGDPYLEEHIKKFPQKKITFGKGGDIEGKILKDEGFLGMEGLIRVKGKEHKFKIPSGILHLSTIEAASAFFYTLDLNLQELLVKLKDYIPLKGRLNLLKSKKGFYLVDDTYNASPYALNQLLKKLQSTPTEGKKILVLGDMLELGKEEEKFHKEAGKEALKVVDILICLGKLAGEAGKIFEKGGKKTYFIKDHKEGAEVLLNILKKGDWVALKGSRGMQMEKIIKIMEEDGAL
ncbi:MAG: UDP-N-acetylmuramoyl-tripeptide--D-alanyl-D-alanine ligase [Thermoanaerobaculia bacterium]